MSDRPTADDTLLTWVEFAEQLELRIVDLEAERDKLRDTLMELRGWSVQRQVAEFIDAALEEK